MRKSRRQIVNRIIEATAVGLVALDLLIYFAVYRPLGEKLGVETHRHAELRQAIRNQQVRVDVLRKFETALPKAGKRLEEFSTNRAPSRREAYSTAAHLIHKTTDAAGVVLTSTAFRLDTEHHDPLERLGVEINAQGSYEDLLKFTHALETANDFILVREFNLTPGGVNGTLGLRLGVELYLTP